MKKIEYVYTNDEISDMRNQIEEAEEVINDLLSVLEDSRRKDRVYNLLNNIVLVRMKLYE